jgi:hypothetical protein
MFTSTFNKGFQLTFRNKLTISVQFGLGSYSSNRNKANAPFLQVSETAEVMFWNEHSGEQLKPLGYVSTESVADFIHLTKNAADLADLSTKITQYNEQLNS